jgi:hypothetical protein
MGLDVWVKMGLVVGAAFWIVTGSLALIVLCVLIGFVIGLADQIR